MSLELAGELDIWLKAPCIMGYGAVWRGMSAMEFQFSEVLGELGNFLLKVGSPDSWREDMGFIDSSHLTFTVQLTHELVDS